MEVAAMSSLAPPSLGSCCAEATTCVWRSRLPCLAAFGRRGLLRSPSGRAPCRPARPVPPAEKIPNPVNAMLGAMEHLTQALTHLGTTLTALADGADLL